MTSDLLLGGLQFGFNFVLIPRQPIILLPELIVIVTQLTYLNIMLLDLLLLGVDGLIVLLQLTIQVVELDILLGQLLVLLAHVIEQDLEVGIHRRVCDRRDIGLLGETHGCVLDSQYFVMELADLVQLLVVFLL